jgi:hypothetical protein
MKTWPHGSIVADPQRLRKPVIHSLQMLRDALRFP